MGQGNDGYHEPFELLSQETVETHRALLSLMEELEAIDWYQQRADACDDQALKDILLHNKTEEMEHAMMSLEWLLRRDDTFAEMARKYLFSQGSIIHPEAPGIHAEEASEAAAEGRAAVGADGSLGIGSLRK